MKILSITFLLVAIALSRPENTLHSNSLAVKNLEENSRSRMAIRPDTSVVTTLFYRGEKNVVKCTFNNASEGDCRHIQFSCGDFGLAEVNLSDKEEALWSSLYSESPSGYQPNPDLVGKVFVITYQKTSVKACDGSEDLHQVDAPLVIGFKLAD